MTITLVRHGETIENATGIIQGQNPGQLSDNGRKQAEAVAFNLKDNSFDAAISSDLKRCVDTVQAILKYHPELKLELAPELREINFGDYQGLKSSDVNWDLLPGSVLERKAPNGESGIEMRQRVIRYINKLLKTYSSKNVLLVTHGGPIRAIMSCVDGIDQIESLELKVDNCSVYTFSIILPLKLTS